MVLELGHFPMNCRGGIIFLIAIFIGKYTSGQISFPASPARYIIENKGNYYKFLQEVRETGNWEDWILYMLNAVEQISKETLVLIGEIKKLMAEYKNILRNDYKFYSHELLNNLFKHPYTKIEFLENDLGVSRITASKYLNKLAKDGLLRKEKLGTGNYYINERLTEILKK